MGYRIILAIHVMGFISWMAGILYLYRLFVYHAEETEPIVKERFKVMEQKLLTIITLPAALVTLLCGLLMLSLNGALLKQPWMHGKLLFAFCLLGATHYAGTIKQQLADGTCKYSGKALRFMNEIPTLLMMGIVILVIVRPFAL